jgi:hypothetical protein
MHKPGFAEFTALHTLPGMRVEVDEARSWFARTHQVFDIIQMSLIDTWAATGAGAFTLSENGLYTVEAWQIFMRHLSEHGVFTVSRWYAPGEVNETGRMVSLAVAALFQMGQPDPRRHIFLAASTRIATLVISRTPFSPSAVDRLNDTARRLEYTVLISPTMDPHSHILSRIIRAPHIAALYEYTSELPLDLTPATDERPFFFNQLPLSRPLHALVAGPMWKAYGPSAGVSAGNIRATATLIMLIVISCLLVVATIVIPLRPAISDVGPALVVAGTIYFALIGIGFMSIEIGLVQRMSVFLGHPIYSLSIVLFSLILATGVGSIASDRLRLNTATRLVVWSLVTGGYFLILPIYLAKVTLAFDGSSLLIRALLSVLLIAPGALFMGWGFPTGMQLISLVDRKPTPWFWGINGGCGVLASGVAVAMSIAFGISVTISIGGLCYLLLTPVALVMTIGRHGRGRPGIVRSSPETIPP